MGTHSGGACRGRGGEACAWRLVDGDKPVKRLDVGSASGAHSSPLGGSSQTKFEPSVLKRITAP